MMKLNYDIKMPPKNKAPVHSGNIIVWMWYFLTPYRWIVIGFFSWRTARYTILSLLPLAVGMIIDGLESGDAQDNPDEYLWFLIGFMTLFAISMFNMVFTYEVNAFEKAARAMTLFSINHLNALPLNWHECQGSGGKLQRVMTGRKGFQELCRHMRWDFFMLVGDVIAIAISLYIMDIPLIYALFYVLFIASYLGASWFFALPFLKLYDHFHDKFEKLLAGVYEFVSAIRTVKAFHLNDIIYQKASELEKIGQESIMATFYTNLLRWTICNFIAAFWLFVLAYNGFYDVLDGTMTAGAFAATFFLAYRMWSSCELIGSIWEKVYEHGNGLSRLIETLRVSVDQYDLEPALCVPNNWSKISLNDVTFRYDGESGQGLNHVSFDVERGQKIAFVGASGAGKSTLVKILMKQMLPSSGMVLIEDVDVSYVPTDEWLSHIGFVTQDVELFNLSIRENILIDRMNLDDDFLQEILKQAALDEFIDRLPDGLDTIIGERGIKLSGGQRQRLGIARALVRQAPIMIFDEATSSLDSISEQKIQQAIENSFEDRTVFVIAHRLSTIRNVDRIIVLEDGCVIEDGGFQELLDKKGAFSHLWSIQSNEKG